MGSGSRHIGVVGGGILGLAVARRIHEVHPRVRVTLLEKETAVAQHQTGRNSGVVHAGLYYQPASLKARLCRRGVDLLRAFADESGIAWRACGKLVVALDETEHTRLRDLFDRSRQNGVPGVRLIGPDEMRATEPEVRGVAAIHSPTTAVIDFGAVARALARSVEDAGGTVVLGAEVIGVRQRRGRVQVHTTDQVYDLDHVIVCAGLEADRLAILTGGDPDPRIVPFRGEYGLLRPGRRHLVRGLIYPVPDPRYPFLGVHLTVRHDGEVLVGPNAVLGLAREGYRRGDVRIADVSDLVRWPGFWRMARRHWRTGLGEIRGSLSHRAFVAQARRYLPALTDDDVLPGPTGIRAQAVGRDGALIDDFRIAQIGRVTAVRNAPSPGATSSLAIAEHVVEQAALDG